MENAMIWYVVPTLQRKQAGVPDDITHIPIAKCPPK